MKVYTLVDYNGYTTYTFTLSMFHCC